MEADHLMQPPPLAVFVKLEDEENDDPIGHVTMFSSLNKSSSMGHSLRWLRDFSDLIFEAKCEF
jgi:hypothetical protein